MNCGGCGRTLEVGDQYIEDTASGFIGQESSEVDSLVADLLGGRDGKVIFCDDCTEDGGDYLFETVYEDEETP